MDAVLDRDLPRRPDDDPAGHLRRRRSRWRDRAAPVCPHYLAAARKPLSDLYIALRPLGGRRLHHRLSRLVRGAGVVERGAGDARLSLCLRPRRPGARDRRGAVGPAARDPDRRRVDAPAADEHGAAVSLAAAFAGSVRRVVVEAGAAMLALFLLLWSLLPIYNMFLIALDPEEGEIEFDGNLWPPQPSLAAFRAVVMQEARYLEDFWHQFGNSLFTGLATMLLTLLIGSLASFAAGRMRLGKGALFTNAALLTYVIPASFLIVPYFR